MRFQRDEASAETFSRSVVFTAEGNPATRPSPMDSSLKLINFDRQVKLAKIVTGFTRYQQTFNLAILQDVQNWLTSVLAEKGSGSVDALYRKSRKSAKSRRHRDGRLI